MLCLIRVGASGGSAACADGESGGKNQSWKTHQHSAKPPDRTRIISKMPMGEMLLVSDGQHVWTYFSRANQYTKKLVHEGALDVLKNFGLGSAAEAEALISRARIIRREEVALDDTARACWVVEIPFERRSLPAPPGAELRDGKMQAWVDETSSFVLRLETTGSSICRGSRVQARSSSRSPSEDCVSTRRYQILSSSSLSRSGRVEALAFRRRLQHARRRISSGNGRVSTRRAHGVRDPPALGVDYEIPAASVERRGGDASARSDPGHLMKSRS